MFNSFKSGFAYNTLAKSFAKLYEGIQAINHDFEFSVKPDEEKLEAELLILAVWVKENINDKIQQYNWSMTAPIVIPNMGGKINLTIAHNRTIGKMIQLAGFIGIVDKLSEV